MALILVIDDDDDGDAGRPAVEQHAPHLAAERLDERAQLARVRPAALPSRIWPLGQADTD